MVYMDENNKTGYPLHGGINAAEGMSGNPIVQEYSEKMHNAQNELFKIQTELRIKESENIMLKETNKQLFNLLQLALGKNDKTNNGNA